MKEQQGRKFVWGSCIAMIIAAMVLLGCEETQQQRSLTVTPNAPSLSRAGDRVVLTASLPQANASITNDVSGLLYPLEWTVSDSSKGHIVSSTANVAVYQCDVGNGANVVVVRDQGDREGLANIN